MTSPPSPAVPPTLKVPLEAELVALAIVPHLIAEGTTPSIAADEPAAAAARLLADSGADAVAVINADGGYLGLVSLRDVTRAAAAGALQAPAAAAMQPRQDWLAPDDTPLDALELFRARRVEHLPVLDAEGQNGERLVGIVSLGQLVRLLHRQFEAMAMQRQRKIFGMEPNEE